MNYTILWFSLNLSKLALGTLWVDICLLLVLCVFHLSVHPINSHMSSYWVNFLAMVAAWIPYCLHHVLTLLYDMGHSLAGKPRVFLPTILLLEAWNTSLIFSYTFLTSWSYQQCASDSWHAQIWPPHTMTFHGKISWYSSDILGWIHSAPRLIVWMRPINWMVDSLENTICSKLKQESTGRSSKKFTNFAGVTWRVNKNLLMHNFKCNQAVYCSI